jgi:pyrimidine operon attenuation protein / uracil phosphoribosyltransferase
MPEKTLVLNKLQIEQRINKLAYQVYEDNFEEKEIIIAGIMNSGYVLAERIAETLKKISPLKVQLAKLTINKHSQVEEEAQTSLKKEDMHNKVVIVVDDVLNSGKTLMYALKPFLNADIKKLRTVVLVDRNHKRYPLAADFVGYPMATTLQEHISVVLDKDEEAVYLS